MRGILIVAIALVALGGAALAADQSVVTGTTVVTSPTGTTTTTTTANGPSATKAELDAANAAFPSSGITPDVKLSGNTGTEEANLLTAAAINTAANQIISRTGADQFETLIIAGNSGLDVSAWMLFDTKIETLKSRFDNDLATYRALANPSRKHNWGTDRLSLTGIGEGLIALKGILSYFATSYQASSVSVSTTDDMLAVAIAGRMPERAIIYSQMVALAANKKIAERFSALTDLANQANDAVVASNTLPPAKKKSIEAAVTNLKNDLADYGSFGTWLLGGPSGNATAPGNLNQVAQAYAAASVLRNGGRVLYVKIHNAAGGIVTKTNLWSTLGAMPLYASAGIVVSYASYEGGTPSAGQKKILEAIAPDDDSTGVYKLAAAGLFAVVVPYHTIGHVPLVVSLDKTGGCDAVGKHYATKAEFEANDVVLDSDAAKYCPR